MKDSMRYFPAMVQWVGFKKAYIQIAHAQRSEGKSTYSFRKLVRLAINTIIAFSDKPLKLVVKLGFLIAAGSLVVAIIIFIQYLNGNITVSGWTSLILSLWFLFGILIFVLGIIGLYVGRIFEKVKNRPVYITSETVNISI